MHRDDRGPADTSPPAIDLSGVRFVRAGQVILDDVDLVVRRGEQWALLGPNGAGKSTLLGICAAITFPSRGAARILGSRMGEIDLRDLRRSIGVVGPRHPLRSDLTVREIVLTGVTSTNELVPRWQPSDDDLTRADLLIKQLGVDTTPQPRWTTMSQGERGRTLIARALMTRPQLLLLDEPSTGLDVAAREQMIGTLDRLAADHPGITSVMVTHHFEELPTATSHAALMRAGRLVAAGPVDQVLTSESVSETFEHPLSVRRIDGRWSVSGR